LEKGKKQFEMSQWTEWNRSKKFDRDFEWRTSAYKEVFRTSFFVRIWQCSK